MDNLSRADNLTLVSVYHNALSRRLLELNEETVRRLNPGNTSQWLVGDNTPADMREKINTQKFIVVPNPHDYRDLGSYQHASAINECLKRVNTRFVVSLDSDFYIVRASWIGDVLAYMQARDLSFFGVTYHPQDYPKYRYFPSVVCMFADLEKVPLDTLDFMPQFATSAQGRVIRTDKDRDTRKKNMRKKIKNMMGDNGGAFLAKILRTFDMQSRRLNIAVARDTSYRIYARYAPDTSYKREYVQPVFDPATVRALSGRVYMPINRIVETFLPDRLCYIPKKSGFFTTSNFRERGFADCEGMGWEEYIWHGEPFGIHMRGSKTWKRNKSEDDEVSLIRKTLEQF